MECFYQVDELVYEISGEFYLNSIHSRVKNLERR
jgi:hypothetical protein